MLRPIAQPIPSREPSPFPLSAIDRAHAQKSDEDYVPHSWVELKQIIADNRLEDLKRWPSDIRKYVQWSNEIRLKHGSVQNFVLRHRLAWTLSPSTTPESGPVFDCASSVPFQDPTDYKILPNDWPYGLDAGITHLIVWSKVRLQTEPTKGDITPVARYQVEDFVQRKFLDRVRHLAEPDDRVLWFKNWTALQSVPGMDHVHVLVRDIPEEIIKEWMQGVDPGEELQSKE